jgi:hypothetical protein
MLMQHAGVTESRIPDFMRKYGEKELLLLLVA